MQKGQGPILSLLVITSSHAQERLFVIYCLTKMNTNNAKAENNFKQVKYESFETSQTIIEQDRNFLKV